MSCFTKLAKSQAPADFLLGRCSAREAPLFTSNPELPGEDEEALLASVRTLEPVQWDRTTPFVQSFTQAGKPALLRGTVVDGWAARNWTWEHLRRLHAGQTLVDVLETDGHHYLSPDKKAAFEPLLRYHVPQRWRNMSADTFFDVMDAAQARFEAEGYERTAAVRALWRAGGARYVHFAPVEGAMTHDVEPRELLFADKEDLRNGMQSVWVSTPGVRTHTHFDSDHNVFVQLLGRKRFVMWPPNQTDALCMFPRLHPLWHKSRVDFERPDFARHAPCARYNTSEAVAVDVRALRALHLRHHRRPHRHYYRRPIATSTTTRTATASTDPSTSAPTDTTNTAASTEAAPPPGAQVGPGDVLYVPPFWWHTVETLSPSVSLTTLSRYHLLYNRMQARPPPRRALRRLARTSRHHPHAGARPSHRLTSLCHARTILCLALVSAVQGIYRMTYHFDKLAHYDARVYSLRAFLVLLVRRMLQAPPLHSPTPVASRRSDHGRAPRTNTVPALPPTSPRPSPRPRFRARCPA